MVNMLWGVGYNLRGWLHPPAIRWSVDLVENGGGSDGAIPLMD